MEYILSTKLEGNDKTYQDISDIQNAIVAVTTKMFDQKSESTSASKPKNFDIGSNTVRKTKVIPTAESESIEDENNDHKIS